MTTVGFYEVARFFRTHDLVLKFQTSCGLPLQRENHRCSKSPPFEVQPAPIRGLTAREEERSPCFTAPFTRGQEVLSGGTGLAEEIVCATQVFWRFHGGRLIFTNHPCSR